MKNIFVLEAISTGRFYVREIAERGYHPVVIYPHLPNISPVYRQYRQAGEAYARQYTDDIYYPTSDDLAEYEELLRRFQPAAVVAGSEIGVAMTDKLADRLGLPGNAPAGSRMRRDKYLMAAALKAAGVPALKSALCHSVNECLQYAKEINSWPLVVKPLAGAGSQGVHFCHDMAELAEKCREVFQENNFFGAKNAAILLQEFAVGTEYIVNTVSLHGRHTLTDMWRYRKISIGSEGNAYDYALLVTEPDEREQELLTYARQALTALGFCYGPSHTEIMLTENGPRLIETGARPMGAVHDIATLQEALGHRIVDVALDTYVAPQQAGEFAARSYRPPKTMMTKVFMAPEAAKLTEIPLLHLLPYLRTARGGDFANARTAMAVVKTVDLETSPGELHLCGSYQEVWHDYQVLRALEKHYFTYLFAPEHLTAVLPVMHVRHEDGRLEAVIKKARRVPLTEWLDFAGRLAAGMQDGEQLMLAGGCGLPQAVEELFWAAFYCYQANTPGCYQKRSSLDSINEK